ncbi:hypothetical protein [Caballeronia sordidicola]|nr:hypothetical protein [Caballeronia sordidicola]
MIVWAMVAMCVVLFIRGAQPHVERPDGENRGDSRDMKGGAFAPGVDVAR